MIAGHTRSFIAALIVAAALLAAVITGAGLLENGRSAGAESYAVSEVSRVVPQYGVAPAAAQARTITYTYDNAGRLTGANYGAKSITYTYDRAGNLVARQVQSGTGGHKVYLPITQRNDQ